MIRRPVIFLVLLFYNFLIAQQDLDKEKKPNQKEIAVSFLVIDILKIDDTKQAMKIDFVIRLSWNDPDLVGKYETSQHVDLNKIWFPDVTLANELNLVKKRKEFAQVNPDGTVSYRQRYQGDITIHIDYTDFPFDNHMFKIQLVAPLTKEIKFVTDTSLTGQADTFSIQEWIISKGEMQNEPYKVLSYEFEACAYQFNASRNLGYYIWKVFIPLILVVFMSWLVFWIDPTKIEAQLAVSATAMLTIIAYQITLSNMLPRISYFTRLDYFIVGSNILVFLALLEAVMSSAIARNNKEKTARNLDRSSRIVFPILYSVVLLITFLS
jgi:hypothetical protein